MDNKQIKRYLKDCHSSQKDMLYDLMNNKIVGLIEIEKIVFKGLYIDRRMREWVMANVVFYRPTKFNSIHNNILLKIGIFLANCVKND